MQLLLTKYSILVGTLMESDGKQIWHIAFLLFLLSKAHSLASALCSTSCVLCSEETIICHSLRSIIDVPNSTQALMLTNGWISLVDNTVLSNTRNLSLLGLSNNEIDTIIENAFLNLSELNILLLDHNRISSRTINDWTFSWLTHLETLSLANNAIQRISGSWFKASKSLKTLQLEGNQLSVLDSDSFSLSKLVNLQNLDLSNNYIMHIGSNSFQNLRQLRTLDLSRNKLEVIPNVFSSLPLLSTLNLDLNKWNCSCELLELASFLNTYIQSPEKLLCDGQGMMCANADHTASRKVLDLTESNCVRSNANTDANLAAVNYISAQEYVRDIALASILFFAGGVLITLAIVWIVFYKLGKRRGFSKSSHEDKCDHLKDSLPKPNQWNFTEGPDALTQASNSHDRNHEGQHHTAQHSDTLALPSKLEPEFICTSCRSSAQLLASVEHGQRNPNLDTVLHLTNLRKHAETEHDKWLFSEVRAPQTQSAIRDLLLQVPPLHQTRQELNIVYGGETMKDTSIIRDGHLATQSILSSKQYQQAHGHQDMSPHSAITCMCCHGKFENHRLLERSHVKDEFRTMAKTQALRSNQLAFTTQALEFRGRNLQRNVTFDLTVPPLSDTVVYKEENKRKSPKYYHKLSLNQVSAKSLKVNISKDSQSKSNTCKIHIKRSLKVKLNLNPFRKAKVNPTSRQIKDNSKAMKTSNKQQRKGSAKRGDNRSKKQQKSKNATKRGETRPDSKSTQKVTTDVENINNIDNIDEKQGHLHQPDTVVSQNRFLPEQQNQAEDSAVSTTLGTPLDPCRASNNNMDGMSVETGLVLSSQSIQHDSNQQHIIQPQIGGAVSNEESNSLGSSSNVEDLKSPAVVQEYLYSPEGSPKRKIRLILPEKTDNVPTSADRKIR